MVFADLCNSPASAGCRKPISLSRLKGRLIPAQFDQAQGAANKQIGSFPASERKGVIATQAGSVDAA